ncbi:MAG: hypothetical protein AAB546_02035 [Patescibacteria group bacterium]
MRNNSYSSLKYKKLQSELMKKNWENGVFNVLIKPAKERICKNIDCKCIFLVKPGNPKVYCSRSCAAHINNQSSSRNSEKNPKLGDLTKEKLTSLYASKSMNTIANEFGVSPNSIVWKMHKFEIPRRSHSDATYLHCNPNGNPFEIKDNLNPDELFLKALALGIYWGEGEKLSSGRVVLTNTDPKMITIFRKFLINICHVNTSKIHYSLICFNDSNLDSVRNHWSNILEISPERFGKITQIPTQGKGTYKRKSQYGVCNIVVCNTKFKSWIMKEITSLF